MTYEFHRDFYNLVKEFIYSSSTTFLLGTRKCGKTVCLKQIKDEIPDTKYIDFKQYTTDEKYDILKQILSDIENNKKIIYLLDEFTSVYNYDIEICKIADAFTDLQNKNTKIVFSGSQSVALGACANKAFAGNTSVISVDFLTYSEFLRFKNIPDASVESYNRFLYETFDFYNDFKSLKDYLEGCLNETIISNMNASEMILGNETNLVKEDTDFLISICYQTLFNLHNHVNVNRFFADNKLQKDIRYYFNAVCEGLDNDVIAKKIQDSFIGSYNAVKSRTAEEIRQALLFLKKCDLITITPVTNSIEDVPNIEKNIITGNNTINIKEDLFTNFNFTIKYPMFYVKILQDVLGEDMPQTLPGPLLGSIVECNARGLLNAGFELKTAEYDDNGNLYEKEIDLVDLKSSTATELTISRKHAKHFDIIPEYFNKVMLTKDTKSVKDGITRIPYYEYLFDLSQNRYVSHKISIDKESTKKTPSPKQVSSNMFAIIEKIAGEVKEMKNGISEIIACERKRIDRSFKRAIKKCISKD